MSDQYGGSPADSSRNPERPGPYQGPGVFGSQPAVGASGTGRPGDDPGQGPGPYRGPGPFGGQPNPYGYQPGPGVPPKQVKIASVISYGLGGLCVLLGLLALTSAGEEIAEMLTGSADGRNLVVGVIFLCGAAYLLPAVFLRKRRQWARVTLIVVAALGIAGGISALPGSILGLALHGTLLWLMLQQPTKAWFRGARP